MFSSVFILSTDFACNEQYFSEHRLHETTETICHLSVSVIQVMLCP